MARREIRACERACDPISEGDEADPMIRQSCALVSVAASAVVGTVASPWPNSAWRAHTSYVSSIVLLARARQVI
jgi:transposase